MSQTLETYIKECHSRGANRHVVSVEVVDGKTHLNISAIGHTSDNPSFILSGNTLMADSAVKPKSSKVKSTAADTAAESAA